MEAEINNLGCGRKDELISFLYEELNADEKLNFVQHTQTCSECRAELSSFMEIRSDVVAWRDATLGALTPVNAQTILNTTPKRKPSAMAALREFFNLSPLWMKGAVAFASLLFCVLAILVVTRRTTPEQVVLRSTPNNSAASPAETSNPVERQVKDQVAPKDDNQKSAELASASNPPRRVRPVLRTSNRTAVASTKNSSRPLTKQERQELAADLGLLMNGEDSDLVLIGDRINQ